MKRLTLIVFLLCSLICAPIVFSACGSPAAPPTPPVEVPSPVVLKFVEPTDMQIDLTTIGPSAIPAIVVEKTVGAGPLAPYIMTGPLFANLVVDNLKLVSGGISELEIPVSATTTSFAGTFTFTTATGVLAGKHDVYLSFADFDIDNSGITEGCSGHTAALPVCVRFWLDGRRYLAWIFDEYPFDDDPATPENEATIGRGRFKFFYDSSLDPEFEGAFEGAEAGFYRQVLSPAEEKSLEVFTRTIYPDGVGPPETTIKTKEFDAHVAVAQDGPADSAFKRVDSVSHTLLYDSALDTSGYMNGEYLGQYIEGQDYWSGSIVYDWVLPDGTPFNYSFSDTCGQISTADAVAQSLCEVIGIRVFDEPFIRALVDADVAVPSNFPETPPL